MTANFISLDSIGKLDALIEESRARPVFIFKDSSSCGISADVREQLEAMTGDIHVIVVQDDRPVSNAVVERLGIRHASPQAIVLRDGKSIYHATHYGIDWRKIGKMLEV